MLATAAFLPVCVGVSAAVNGPLRWSSDSVNAFLQFYFSDCHKPRNCAVLSQIFSFRAGFRQAGSGCLAGIGWVNQAIQGVNHG